MRPARAMFKSIETRYRLFLSESILGSTYVMTSIPLKVSSSIPKPREVRLDTWSKHSYFSLGLSGHNYYVTTKLFEIIAIMFCLTVAVVSMLKFVYVFKRLK